jgi:uncharacterized protein (DUF2384 family)
MTTESFHRTLRARREGCVEDNSNPERRGARADECSVSVQRGEWMRRIASALERAGAALGSEEAADAWLARPHPLLNGETPVARLRTESGMREVEDMLTVIDETAAA